MDMTPMLITEEAFMTLDIVITMDMEAVLALASDGATVGTVDGIVDGTADTAEDLEMGTVTGSTTGSIMASMEVDFQMLIARQEVDSEIAFGTKTVDTPVTVTMVIEIETEIITLPQAPAGRLPAIILPDVLLEVA